MLVIKCNHMCGTLTHVKHQHAFNLKCMWPTCYKIKNRIEKLVHILVLNFHFFCKLNKLYRILISWIYNLPNYGIKKCWKPWIVCSCWTTVVVRGGKEAEQARMPQQRNSAAETATLTRACGNLNGECSRRETEMDDAGGERCIGVRWGENCNWELGYLARIRREGLELGFGIGIEKRKE
jgi:hypothetical protein